MQVQAVSMALCGRLCYKLSHIILVILLGNDHGRFSSL